MMFSTRDCFTLFFLVATVTLFGSCSGSTRKATTSGTGKEIASDKAPEVKEIRDYDIQLFDEEGSLSKIKLSQAVGQGKVVVIDFWATWCGPCRYAIPDLVALQTEYKGKGVQVFGLSTEDPEDSRELVSTAAKNFKMNYKVGFVTREMFLSFTQTPSIPQCFVFGKDGRLVKKFVGFNPNASPRMLRETVEKALES